MVKIFSKAHARRIGAITLKGLFALLFMGLLLELGTRLLAPVDQFDHIPNRFDPRWGIGQSANGSGFIVCPEYAIEIRTSDQELRDRHYEIPKPLGSRRVLCLGDSFTNGYGVDADSTFAKVLERSARGVEVVNAGVGATGTAHQLAWFVDRGLDFDPDAVVLTTTLNDFVDNASSGLYRLESNGELTRMAARQSPTLAALRRLRGWPGYEMLLARSHFFNAFKQAFAGVYHEHRRAASVEQGGRGGAAATTEADRSVIPFADLSLALVQALQRECESRDIALWVLPVPPGHSGEQAAARHRAWREMLEEAGLRVIDVEPLFDETGRGHLYYPVDGHWTASGHRAAARALQPVLDSLP